jgi:hypothetical protein
MMEEQSTITAGDISLKHWIVDASTLKLQAKAFFSCPTLLSIQIPTTVVKIGKSAFSSCVNLTTVTFTTPPSSSSGAGSGGMMLLKRIGESAFAGCSALKEILLPSCVKEIDECAFWKCTALTTVQFAAELAMSSSSSLLMTNNNKSRSSRLIRIGESCFAGCTALESIDIPSSVKELGGYAFRKCSSLKRVGLAAHGLVHVGPS